MNKKLFYILSFTWGLPLTIVGGIVALILFISGYDPKRYHWCWYFEIGKNWGGLNLGPLFFCSKPSSIGIMTHEFGHAIQNCMFGPITPFIVHIPSGIRYWLREIQTRKGNPPKTGYYDIWFERQATMLGIKYTKP